MDHFLSVNGKARGQADSRLNKGYTEHKMMASKRKKKKKKGKDIRPKKKANYINSWTLRRKLQKSRSSKIMGIAVKSNATLKTRNEMAPTSLAW